MANPTSNFNDIQFQPIHDSNLKLSSVVTTPKGNSFRILSAGSRLSMISETDPNNQIIITGPAIEKFDIPGVGRIGDAIRSNPPRVRLQMAFE